MLFIGILRNFIDIEGLSSYDELTKEIDGQVIQISECENISLPIKNINIRNIYQLLIDIQITSSKNIKTPINTLVVLDGVKKFKVIYYDEQNKAGILDVNVPFNTFIELKDKDEEFKSAKVHVLDGFFQLLQKNILYSHLLYHINIFTSSNKNSRQVKNIVIENTYTPKEDLNSLPLKDVCIDHNIPSKLSLDMSYEILDTEITKDYITKNKTKNEGQKKKTLNNFSKLKVLTKKKESTAEETSINYDLHNELSLSNDTNYNSISNKINAPTVREEPLLIDKWCNFINIDEEYL